MKKLIILCLLLSACEPDHTMIPSEKSIHICHTNGMTAVKAHFHNTDTKDFCLLPVEEVYNFDSDENKNKCFKKIDSFTMQKVECE